MKKGFTIIESLLVVIMSSVATVGAYTYLNEKAEDTTINSLAGKITKTIKGFDQRIFIDKYDQSLWPTITEYSTNNQVQDFFKKELIARTASCGNSNGWKPSINDPLDTEEVSSKEKLKLIPCSLWLNSKIELNLKTKLVIQKDVKNIKNINIYYFYENEKDFKENYIKLRKLFKKIKEVDLVEVTGSHKYKFVDMNASDPSLTSLTSKECLMKKENCGLLAQYNADGTGAEYLDVNGQNSMVNSKISFIEKNGEPVIKTCSTFIFDPTTSIWKEKKDITCGLGIDKDKGTKFVDADVNSLSTKRVLLDRLCKINITGSMENVPCGIYIDNTSGSTMAITAIDVLNATKGFVHLLDVNKINTDIIEVTNKLTVDGETELATLTTNNIATFKSDVTFKGANNKIEQDLAVLGTTNLNTLNVSELAIFNKNVEVNGDLKIMGKIEADSIILGSITKSQINKACDREMIGALKVYKNGNHTESVICTEFTDIESRTKIAWKLANARIGQIMPFDGTCPDGFEYFTKASGRFLIGENETLLKNKSVAQVAALVNEGKVFLDPNGNVLRYKVGDKGGEAYHTLTIEEMPSHSHDVPTIKATCTGSDCAGSAMVRMDHRADTVWSRNSAVKNSETGGNKNHENRPPYYTVNYCIYSGR